jgi:nucleoid DNA-binding protein
MRSALIDRLASTADISERDAAAQALGRGDRVELRGFGAFTARRHQAHAAHNPRTGDLVHVPAKKSVHFKPGRELRRALNGDDQALAALRAKRDAQRRRRDEKNGQLNLF